MRSLLAVVVVGMVASTAQADPFATRNPAPDAAPSASTETPPARDGGIVADPGHTQRTFGKALVISGGVALVASVALGFYERKQYDDALSRYNAGNDIEAARYDANHAREMARVWGTGLMVTGVAVAAVGAYAYYTAPLKIRRERVAVVPAVGSGGIGLSLSGGF